MEANTIAETFAKGPAPENGTTPATSTKKVGPQILMIEEVITNILQ
jgi:hypothetical protein